MTDWLFAWALILAPIAVVWFHHRHVQKLHQDTPFRRAALRWHEQRRQADRRRDRELGLVRNYRRQA